VPEGDVVWFAYFAPYDLTRHAALIGRSAGRPGVTLRPLGASLDGRALDRLIVGEPAPGLKTLWILARQHPGESMAEWWMEGFLGRLLDPHDALAARLRAAAVLHIVPNINPDGSVPASPTPSWQAYNVFRARPSVDTAALDLTAAFVDVCAASCEPGGLVEATVQLANLGGVDSSPDVSVALYADDGGSVCGGPEGLE
jgi:hypothetical protein